MKNVGLTADLAVFDITLPAAGGDIHLRFVPLAAAGALESGLHGLIIWGAGAQFMRATASETVQAAALC